MTTLRPTVWTNKKSGTITVFASRGGLTANFDLSKDDAETMIRELQAAIEGLPRVVTADDLGMQDAA